MRFDTDDNTYVLIRIVKLEFSDLANQTPFLTTRNALGGVVALTFPTTRQTLTLVALVT